MSSLVSEVLFRLLLGVVAPGVKGFIPQLWVAHYLSFFSEHVRMICLAPTAGGHGAGKRKPLAAVALKVGAALLEDPIIANWIPIRASEARRVLQVVVSSSSRASRSESTRCRA